MVAKARIELSSWYHTGYEGTHSGTHHQRYSSSKPTSFIMGEDRTFSHALLPPTPVAHVNDLIGYQRYSLRLLGFPTFVVGPPELWWATLRSAVVPSMHSDLRSKGLMDG